MQWTTHIPKEDAEKGMKMRENMITALEASWEMDPVLMEDELWPRIDKICLDTSVSVSLRVAQELQSSPEVRMK